MSDPRTRRLVAEHDLMRVAFVGHDHIDVQPIGWHPADCYRVTYRVPGVTLDASGQPALVQEHVVIITAGEMYPRDRPTTRAETALFHPNVSTDGTGVIDSGELWTAQRTLVDLVLQLGAIIQLQEYDLDVPLNAIAGRWVAENTSIFPVGHVSLQAEVPEEHVDDEPDAALDDEPAFSSAVPPDTIDEPGSIDEPYPVPEPDEPAEAERPVSEWAPPKPTAP